jgi:phosphatidylethanolamine/phosphatidyl-N-methylethanolamine N-methyltransferase
MFLKHSYTLIAPFYDVFLAAATHAPRRKSLAPLMPHAPLDVLINGVGTGLDLPHLPKQHRYVGLDLTPGMLRRAIRRSDGLHFAAVEGDAQRLPFADESFDAVVLHLILAVVPEPSRCLMETARVVRPGGSILVFDKFLRHGERGWLKRAVNPLARRLATRLDVVFEEVLGDAASLERVRDEPALAGGWFRLIELKKN